MRHYLSTIHTRSDEHKKRFAFLSSLGITLSIFLIWSLVRFVTFSSDTTSTIATNNVYNTNSVDNTANAAAPISNITSGLSDSFTALKNQFNSVKGEVKSVNLQSEYDQMKKDALVNPTGNQ